MFPLLGRMLAGLAALPGKALRGVPVVGGNARAARAGRAALVKGRAGVSVPLGAVASAATASAKPSGRRGLMEKVFGLQIAGSIFSSSLGLIGRQFPAYQHTISVAAEGGPAADIADVWKLVLATAFGRYRFRVRNIFADSSIEATWDITDKTCAVKISYENSGIGGAKDVAPGAADADYHDPAYFLGRGPLTETVGGNWPVWLKRPGILGAVMANGEDTLSPTGTAQAAVVGGLGVAGSDKTGNVTVANKATVQKKRPDGTLLVSGAARPEPIGRTNLSPPQILPDDGRLITTILKNNSDVQPPQPPIDGTDFIALVSNALTDPCILPGVPPQISLQRPQPTGGKQFYAAGGNVDTAVLAQQIQDYRNKDIDTTAQLNEIAGADTRSDDVIGRVFGFRAGRLLADLTKTVDGYPRPDPNVPGSPNPPVGFADPDAVTVDPVPFPADGRGDTNAGDN